jgi:amino acid adenylation domain-containing protein
MTEVTRIQELAREITQLPPGARASLIQTIKVNPGEYNLFPLSYAQERLWFLDRITPGNPNYNMAATVEFKGQLRINALQASLDRVVARQEALRTGFLDFGGEPMQFVQPPFRVVLRRVSLVDLNEKERVGVLERAALQEAMHRFDLSAGYLFRCCLFTLSDTYHVLSVNLHHIICDDWSLGVLIKEIAQGVETEHAAESENSCTPLQPAEFACWQRDRLQGALLEQLTSYWKVKLDGAPHLLTLSISRKRPAEQTFRGARFNFRLHARTVTGLNQLAARHRATIFMVLLAAFKALLLRYSNVTDLVVATPVANRENIESEDVIGLFFNTLVLRTDLSGNPTFDGLIGRVRETALEAYANQGMPFVKLVEALSPDRSLSHNPLVQVMFILQNSPRGEFRLPGTTTEIHEMDNRTAQFDLILSLRPEGQELSGYLQYATDLFDARQMRRFAGHFAQLIDGAIANPERKIGSIELLTPAERTNAAEKWNTTARELPEEIRRPATLHGLVERQALERADAIAVAGSERLTYADVEKRANRLARYLMALGAAPGVNIGICLRQSAAMVVALLAVAKSGSAYVPLDPNQPAERLQLMAREAGIRLLLSSEALASHLLDAAVPVVCVDRDAAAIQAMPSLRPDVNVQEEDLAYVIYTSGSTGEPKGVMIRHAGIVNNLLDLNRACSVNRSSSVLTLSSFSFDMCVYETFGMLAAGGTIITPEAEQLRDPAEIARLIRQHGITVWNSAPALLEAVLSHVENYCERSITSIKVAILGGDWVPVNLPQRLARIAPESRLFVLGGATEASIHSTLFAVGAVDPSWVRIPYGRPMANQRGYILDGGFGLCPVGFPGELYIGGDGLARGYFGKPAFTAERFLPDPYAATPGARMYRTGDLARYEDDGLLILIGRVDYQIKIRGHRIELGEIEAVLERHASVQAAVVSAIRGHNGDNELVGYVIPRGEVDLADLRVHLKKALPSCMIPRHLVPLDAFPLSANGKVDRRALPQPPAVRLGPFEELNPLEQVMAAIFVDVLGLGEPPGRNDDFFDLGGHSLRAMQLVSRVRDFLHLGLPLRDFLEEPTTAGASRSVERIAADAGLPLSDIVSTILEVLNMDEQRVQDRLTNVTGTS